MPERTTKAAPRKKVDAPETKTAAEPEGIGSVLALQRSAGNAAVVAMLAELDTPIQPKLQVGAVNDPAELEADRIADQVLRNLEAETIGRHGDAKIRRMPPSQIYQATMEEESAETEDANAEAKDADRGDFEGVAEMYEREDDEAKETETYEGVAGMYDRADTDEVRAGQGYQAGTTSGDSDTQRGQQGQQEQESNEKESEEDSGAPPTNADLQGAAPQTNGEQEQKENENEGQEVNRAFRGVRRAASAADASSAPGHGFDGGPVDDGVANRIESARGGGRPLDEATRTRMETGFGADFSNVRLHEGSAAQELNRALNAQAFTTGADIFLGGGVDDRVLAHELAHTVQQGASVRRFMANAAFEQLTYESRTSLKSTAQTEILKMLTAYAALCPAPKKKGDSPKVPPEKLDNAIALVTNMKAAARAYIDAKNAGKPKDIKPKRLAGFVSFEIDCGLELDKLAIQKTAASGSTQEPVSVDDKGLQKLQQHYSGTLSGSMEKAALAVEQLAGENGASGEFTLDVDVPVSPGVSVGAHFKFEAKRGGRPQDPKPGAVEVACELGFKVGGDALFAKIQAGLGGYFKAGGRDAQSAMKLVSYGLYRRCRESSVIPAGVGNKLWGGDSGEKGKQKAEAWSLRVEEEEFTDNESFVETGAYASVGAKAEGGVASVEGEVKGSTGKKYDKESLTNSAKGGVGEENTTGNNWFAQQSTGRSVSALELSAKATLIEAFGAELKLNFQWEASGKQGEASKLRGIELQVRGHGSLPSGAFADKLSALVIDFAGKVKSLQKGQLQKATTLSKVGAGLSTAAGIADTTVTGVEGAPTSDILKNLITTGSKTAAKTGAKEGGKSLVDSASKVGLELAYTFKYDDGACFSQFEILHRKALDAKVPGLLSAELIRRKRLLVGSNQGGTWLWELMA